MTAERGSFGAMTREDFQTLVDAPYGAAKERINNPFDILLQTIVCMISEHQRKVRDPVADDDFLMAEAIDLADRIIEKIDTWGLLR